MLRRGDELLPAIDLVLTLAAASEGFSLVEFDDLEIRFRSQSRKPDQSA